MAGWLVSLLPYALFERHGGQASAAREGPIQSSSLMIMVSLTCWHLRKTCSLCHNRDVIHQRAKSKSLWFDNLLFSTATSLLEIGGLGRLELQ